MGQNEWQDGRELTNGVRAGKLPPGWVGSAGPAAVPPQPERPAPTEDAPDDSDQE